MTGSFTDRWAPRFLYALIVLQAVPFFGLSTGLDWPGIRRLNFYKLIVIVLLLGLLSARLDRVRAALRSRTKLIALCAALAIWVGLFLGSVAYYPGLRSSLEIFLLYWTPSLLVFTYLLLAYPSSRRRALILSLAGFYALVLAFGYFEWLTWKTTALDAFFLQFRGVPHYEWPYQSSEFLKVSGTLGPPGLAEAILIGLPIVAGLSVEALRSRRWLILTLSFVLFPLGLLLLLRTFERHPLVVVLAEFLVFIVLALRGRKGRRILVAGLSAVLLSLLLGWGFLIAQGHGHLILARYFAIADFEKGFQDPAKREIANAVEYTALKASRSIANRVAAYKGSLVIIGDWPWTGIGMGPEGFSHYWKSIGPRWGRQDQPLTILTHAHNFYLQMFVSGGVISGFGFLALLFLIFRRSWQAWKMGRARGVPLLSPLEIGVLTAVAGVFVSMLFDFKYNLQWSALILWVLLGTVILILDNPDGQDSSHATTGNRPAAPAQES